jgi:hypothetical protein
MVCVRGQSELRADLLHFKCQELQTKQTDFLHHTPFTNHQPRGDAGSRTRLWCMSRSSGSPLWAPKLPRYRTTSRPSEVDRWSPARNMGQSPSQEAQTGANGGPKRRFLRTDLGLNLAYDLQLSIFTIQMKNRPVSHLPMQQVRVLRTKSFDQRI